MLQGGDGPPFSSGRASRYLERVYALLLRAVETSAVHFVEAGFAQSCVERFGIDQRLVHLAEDDVHVCQAFAERLDRHVLAPLNVELEQMHVRDVPISEEVLQHYRRDRDGSLTAGVMAH